MTPLPSLTTWLGHPGVAVDALCLDIDGVLLNDTERLPGSRRLLDLLDRQGLPFVLLTNDGNHATQEKAQRLQQAGLAVSAGQIISCGHAIALWVRRQDMAGQLFFAMGDTGRPCYAEAAGLRVTRDVQQLSACSGVVIGETHYDWEPVINAVINYLIDHPAAPLVVPNPDEFYPGPRLKIHVAAGAVGRFIQHVLNAYGVAITPVFLGKPHTPIFELAHQALERRLGRAIAPQRVWMVGDNLASDIAGGRAMGYATALILSGVTPLTALAKSKLTPDMVFERL
jgi:HAD superfamily hydrolase (TIGR01450 family)